MEYLELLYQKHRTNGILVDSNLLLVCAVGLFDPDLIQNFKRTRNYTIKDFDLLKRLLSLFTRVLTTPNILTEVSNLSKSLDEESWAEFLVSFKKLITALDERSVSSRTATTTAIFEKYGLADAVIAHLSEKRSFLVITDDLPMYSFLHRHFDVVNFTHLRSARWL